MNLAAEATRLARGETVTFLAVGGSMSPRIKSGATVTVRPLSKEEPLETRTVVLARIGSRHYLHLVSAIHGDRVRISNNHGRINGWTDRENVLGVLVST